MLEAIRGQRHKREVENDAEAIRARCRTLAGFAREAWHVLEPNATLVWNWHLDAICDHLEAVTRGEINRLLINVPPGSSKSLLVSVLWPAYEWTFPHLRSKRYLTTSFNDGPVKRDTRKCRDLILSEWYRALWPEVVLTRTGETSFANSNTGTREGVAFGSLTSQRADCVVGSTMIDTDQGEFAISDIVNDALSCNVRSYDIHSRKLVYRPVQAVARGASSDIYRVHTASGRVVECTGDHRVYTTRGYVEARLLSEGDVLLLAVRSAGCEDRRGDESEHDAQGGAPVLRPQLRDDLHEHAIGQARSPLHDMRNECAARKRRLLAGMPRGVEGAHEGEDQEGFTDAGLRGLRDCVSGPQPGSAGPVLLAGLQGQGALSGHRRGEEPRMARGRRSATLRLGRAPGDQCDAPGNPGPGRKEVRRLLVNGWADDASHRYGHSEQRAPESRDALPRLSYGPAQCGAAAPAQDTVAMVERVRGEQAVYDLQVSGTQCFFANGILVHNCLIIDDPHSTETAESPTERATTTRRFREGALNRLNDQERSAIVVVMQRLHEDDVSGTIMKLKMGYTHLCLPMEFEPERACSTRIGFKDPRTVDGDLLDPVRFPRPTVESLKKGMGSYAYAGQYQQRPTARDGGLFKRAWFEGKLIAEAPRNTRWVRHWDLAATKKLTAARTAGVKIGKAPDGSYIVGHVVKTQDEGPAIRRLIKATAEIDGPSVSISLPQDPGQAGKVQAKDMIAMLAGFRAHAEPETGDKTTRAEPFAAQCEAGNVFIVRGEWNDDYIDELCLFPGGSFKDQVDASSGAFGRLANSSRYTLANVS